MHVTRGFRSRKLTLITAISQSLVLVFFFPDDRRVHSSGNRPRSTGNHQSGEDRVSLRVPID